MFGRTVELRRAVHTTAVRVGFIGASALIGSLCIFVMTMQATLPGGHLSPAIVRALVPVFAVLAIVSAAFTVFASPLAFRYGGSLAARVHVAIATFSEAVHSTNDYERAAGRLGLLSIAQMMAAAIPTVLGFGVFVAGAHVSVFSVFVALSVVILAAVCPRASEWDDAVAQLVSDGLTGTEQLEDTPA